MNMRGTILLNKYMTVILLTILVIVITALIVIRVLNTPALGV